MADRAINVVYEKDYGLIGLKANERAIAHRLAVYLECAFPKMNVDCEYNRYGKELGPKTLPGVESCKKRRNGKAWIIPDILIHTRGSRDQHNMAVFEIKSHSHLDECDKMKLEGMTLKGGRFKYEYGVGIEFFPDHYTRVLLVNGEDSNLTTVEVSRAKNAQ